MSGIYKTPGVYVEEIPKFPPSIAPVETAIPAFIGYTEKADNLAAGDLLKKPRRIGSLLEYEHYFGGPAPLSISEVKLDNSNNFKSAKTANAFYLYDSLRLFYMNGGGDCYIVSAATYDTAANSSSDFLPAIDALAKADEPTIIVFPDNSLLTNDPEFYQTYQAALMQCEELKDRVVICHTMEDDDKGNIFRDKIGINNLKYGCTYTPWLKSGLPKKVRYRDFQTKIFRDTQSVNLSELTMVAEILSQINNLETAIVDVGAVNTAINSLIVSPQTSLRGQYDALVTAYNSSALNVTGFQDVVTFFFDIFFMVDALAGTLGNTEFVDELKNLVNPKLKNIAKGVIEIDQEAKAEITGYTSQFSSPALVMTEWGNIFEDNTTPGVPDNVLPSTWTAGVTGISPVGDDERMNLLIAQLLLAFDQLNAHISQSIVAASKAYEDTYEAALFDTFPLYKSIVLGIQGSANTLPPSGAVAGVFASVDRTRGVWKAPANVSLNGVIEPVTVFSNSELEHLNVDVNAGKSINAIRAFTGKGTLVYGARTLAGNDNEWRYVNVRRFFNFVEESVKKATEQFVFEPNDANTWVRVQAMIENFLTTLWRQGALQGVKPEHAFYVAVGLGKTMTPLDILEGRMIIEIGMAAVRPAEFIILRFSHKMAES